MRAKEFLIELPLVSKPTDFKTIDPDDEEGFTSDNLTRIAKQIKAECHPFITENYRQLTNSMFLYRGIRHAMDLLVTGNPRTDRVPKDVPGSWHSVLNKYFIDTFGWAYRSASLFATQSQSVSSDYGTPYVIFPVGNYTLCYSPFVTDAYAEISSSQHLLFDFVRKLTDKQSTILAADYLLNDRTDEVKSTQDLIQTLMVFLETSRYNEFDDNFQNFLIDFFLPKLRYTETKTYSEINTDTEIMVRCNKYYGIRTKDIITQKAFNELLLGILY